MNEMLGILVTLKSSTIRVKSGVALNDVIKCGGTTQNTNILRISVVFYKKLHIDWQEYNISIIKHNMTTISPLQLLKSPLLGSVDQKVKVHISPCHR